MQDIIDLQRRMYETWERNFGDYLEATLRDPNYLALVGRWWQLSFDWLDLSRACVRPWMQAADVPTNRTLDGLYRSVHDLEMRLLELEERLDDCRQRSMAQSSDEQ